MTGPLFLFAVGSVRSRKTFLFTHCWLIRHDRCVLSHGDRGRRRHCVNVTSCIHSIHVIPVQGYPEVGTDFRFKLSYVELYTGRICKVFVWSGVVGLLVLQELGLPNLGSIGLSTLYSIIIIIIIISSVVDASSSNSSSHLLFCSL